MDGPSTERVPVLPIGYDALTAPELMQVDLPIVGALVTGGDDLVTRVLTTDDRGDGARVSVRLYRAGERLMLADLLPWLERLALRAEGEQSFAFAVDGDRVVHLHDVTVTLPAGVDLDEHHRMLLEEAITAQVTGRVESDGFNRLVLLAGLTVRQVEVVRAYARYLRQTPFPVGQQYVESALARRPEVVRLLVDLFEVRHGPGLSGDDRAVRSDDLAAALVDSLDAVESLDDDRVLRALWGLVDATVRTNAFCRGDDGAPHRPAVAFKFDPARVPDLPQPRPMFEIWVCSPRVEGVHLRGGRIARGGIRWSDRSEDVRTEVLGLVRAQMEKNSVIVPTGAKGGFVVKAGDGQAAYREYIGALLDLTDDVRAGEVVHPEEVVCHDGPDPYLVVAADKGTARFSDLANEIAVARSFWLGDAFASGGSSGYDHKAMGITARGAWESARRHARTLGRDADRDELTVVGVGDMSGDVFGNGLLSSPNLRLVAAFDHRHVFCDPDPDPARSFAERQRLFGLARSSWDDYDRAVLSAGGGVYPRSAKRIEISEQMRALLDVDRRVFTPAELIRCILQAPVDMIWNGGIGTYVKCSDESHLDAADRSNDAVRVDGRDLRCAMFVEGGNLGVTQRGRIEYALHGGLVNTDAIDNSAGVDCSDHEVNIKILLADVMASTGMSRDERDRLLVAMTDDVARSVLADNTAQTLALSIARRQSGPMVSVHTRQIAALEAEGLLDRRLEHLPDERRLAERQTAGTGLAVPEFATLLSKVKNSTIDELTASTLPDDPTLLGELHRYFPPALRSAYTAQIDRHPLRREIIATRLGNQMFNTSGISFLHRMDEETGAATVDVMRAWVAGVRVFGVEQWWQEIHHLAAPGVIVPVRADVQIDLFLELRRMLERGVLWLLRHRRPPLDIDSVVDRFAAPIERVSRYLDDALCGPMRERVFTAEAGRLAAGVPEALAQRSGVWPLLHTLFDVVEVAGRTEHDELHVAATYWRVFDRLDLIWLWDAIGALPRSDRWQTQARSALRDDLLGILTDLTVDALACHGADQWCNINERMVSQVASRLVEIRRVERHDVAVLTVALRHLRNLALVSELAVPDGDGFRTAVAD